LFGKDFKALNLSYNWKKYTQKVEYTGLKTNLKFDLNLLGASQVYNAGMVLCACELLKGHGFKIDFQKLSDVFKNIEWNARFEVRKLKLGNKRITLVIDGCHNLQAVDNFLQLYKESPFSGKRNKLIFAVMQEKEYKKIIKRISPFVSTVNLVDINNGRAVKTEELRKEFLKYKDAENVSVYESIEDCLKNAVNNDVLFCLGSFYLAGKIIKFIEEKNV